MTPVYETCSACGWEFLYPHLCREHMLCGICHPKVVPGGFAPPRQRPDTQERA